MSHLTVKDGIKVLLGSLALAESTEAINFESAAANEYGNTYILKAVSGEMDNAESETLVNKLYDVQQWSIQVAVGRTTHNDIINYDELCRIKDNILQKLDNPANWSTFVRILKYKNWQIVEFANYFVLNVNLKVIDTITY